VLPPSWNGASRRSVEDEGCEPNDFATLRDEIDLRDEGAA
jgi:hypothetical protein